MAAHLGLHLKNRGKTKFMQLIVESFTKEAKKKKIVYFQTHWYIPHYFSSMKNMNTEVYSLLQIGTKKIFIDSSKSHI